MVYLIFITVVLSICLIVLKIGLIEEEKKKITSDNLQQEYKVIKNKLNKLIIDNKALNNKLKYITKETEAKKIMNQITNNKKEIEQLEEKQAEILVEIINIKLLEER